jgi:hypothetical protein
MDHFRTTSFELRFGPLNFEHRVTLPRHQRELLEDVLFELRGHPTTDSERLKGPNDIRLYFEDVDVTEAYLEELRSLLDLQNQDDLAAAYAKALDNWISMARKLGAAYGGDPEADAERAEELKAIRPISSLMDKLGSVNAGYSGYLHLFNFLYSDVDVPPVSARKVITRYNTAAGSEVVNSANLRVLTISSGSCRLFDDAWEPSHVGGTVMFRADMRYHNELADRIADIEQRLEELEEFIDEQLQAILEALGPDGDLQRAISQARAATRTAAEKADSIGRELQSQSAQLDGVKAAAQDLQEAVEAL